MHVSFGKVDFYLLTDQTQIYVENLRSPEIGTYNKHHPVIPGNQIMEGTGVLYAGNTGGKREFRKFIKQDVLNLQRMHLHSKTYALKYHNKITIGFYQILTLHIPPLPMYFVDAPYQRGEKMLEMRTADKIEFDFKMVRVDDQQFDSSVRQMLD